ncbi:MAG TPA: glycosyltransferase family A protein [Gemmatimonadota bacterium]|nr:glycosyltransferase family A protein [Gemmatimonadota bacterium]
MSNVGRISCVVPVFNGDRYLAESLDSILAQSLPADEIVVVDDGSTDGTAEVAARYVDAVRLVRQENAGSPAARNRGVTESRGDLIAFGDADDLWHPDRLARQIERFEQRADLDCCIAHVQNFWSPEATVEKEMDLRHGDFTLPHAGVITMTGLVRRSIFDRVGLFLPSLRHHDGQEWQVRARDHGAVIEVIPEVLMSRRVHDGNESRRRRADESEGLLAAIKMSLDRRRAALTPTESYSPEEEGC